MSVKEWERVHLEGEESKKDGNERGSVGECGEGV